MCVCKGIRINTRVKNYAQHPLVWKESNLRLAPLPLDVPRAGQLLTPRVDVPLLCRQHGAHGQNLSASLRAWGSRQLSAWTATLQHRQQSPAYF